MLIPIFQPIPPHLSPLGTISLFSHICDSIFCFVTKQHSLGENPSGPFIVLLKPHQEDKLQKKDGLKWPKNHRWYKVVLGETSWIHCLKSKTIHKQTPHFRLLRDSDYILSLFSVCQLSVAFPKGALSP